MPNQNLPNALPMSWELREDAYSAAEYFGGMPMVTMWGAKPDLRTAEGASTSGANVTCAGINLSEEDVGKRCIVWGGGAPSGKVVVQTDGNIFEEVPAEYGVIASFRAEFGEKVIMNVMAYEYIGAITLEYEIFGSNTDDFASETSVIGPEILEMAGSYDWHAIDNPSFKYYRIKMRKLTEPLAYVWGAWSVHARCHAGTITAVSGDTATLDTTAHIAGNGYSVAVGTPCADKFELAIDAMRTAGAVSSTSTIGGRLFIPPGRYLWEHGVNQKSRVSLIGATALSTWIMADPSTFEEGEYMVSIGGLGPGQPPTEATNLRNVCLDCARARINGVYSETIQENAGVFEVTIVQFWRHAIKLYTYGCQHYSLESLWLYGSTINMMDDQVKVISLQQLASTPWINKITAITTGAYCTGYGTGIWLQEATSVLHNIHIEAAAVGIHFDANSHGGIIHTTGGKNVQTLVRVENTAVGCDLTAIAKEGGYVTIDDRRTGHLFTEHSVSRHNIQGFSPFRLSGAPSMLSNIMEILPSTLFGGRITWAIDALGNWFTHGGAPDNPNIVTLIGNANYGGDHQGGLIGINSRPINYPRHRQTSTIRAATFDPTTDRVHLPGHGYVDTQAVMFHVDPDSADTLPTGISTDQQYVVVNHDTDTFQLSTTVGGPIVNFTDAGSGTLYASVSNRAMWLRIAARAFEILLGRANNNNGAVPADTYFRVSPTGVEIPRLFFPTGEQHIGQEKPNRWKLTHKGTNGDVFTIAGSSDNGVTWNDYIYLYQALQQILIPSPVRLKFAALSGQQPLCLDSNQEVIGKRIPLNDNYYVDVAGLTTTEVVGSDGQKLVSIPYADIKAALGLTISDIAGLSAALAGKANVSHTHTFAGTALPSHSHAETGTTTSAVTAGTPAGTIS